MHEMESLTGVSLVSRIMKELQRRGAAHKASDENTPFDRIGVYPSATTAASHGESNDHNPCLRICFSFY